MAYGYRVSIPAPQFKKDIKELTRNLPFKISYLIVYNDAETYFFCNREIFPYGLTGYFKEITTPIRKATVERIKASLNTFQLDGNKTLL